MRREEIMTERLLRVIQRNRYSRMVNLPADFCRALNIERRDILSCKLDKNRIMLERVTIE